MKTTVFDEQISSALARLIVAVLTSYLINNLFNVCCKLSRISNITHGVVHVMFILDKLMLIFYNLIRVQAPVYEPNMCCDVSYQ